MLQDFRLGIRSLAGRPGFTAVAVLTLALGIGANTAVFSVVNSVILRPYTFPDLDRLVLVREAPPGEEPTRQSRLAAADALEIAKDAQVFESAAPYRFQELTLTSDAEPRPAWGCAVSATFFEVLRAGPALGRAFVPGEDQPGRDGVAVVSHAFWQRLGGEPGLLGRTLEIDGRPRTVVGIMPRGFDYPVPVDIWLPLALGPKEATERSQKGFYLLARLRPGVSLGAARSALESAGRRMEREHPETRRGRRLVPIRLREELYAYTLPIFLMLQAAAAFLLCLAAANLANLLFARLVGRQRELAIRQALGASRFGLARLLTAESLVLCLGAAVVAVLASLWTVHLIRAGISPDYTKWIPGWDRIQVDGTVLGFSLGMAALLGVALGAAAAFHRPDADLLGALKAGGAATTSGPAKARLRAALVAGQMALALVLLVGAGLMLRGFQRVAGVFQGFEPRNVLTFRVALPASCYANETRTIAFQDELLRRLAGLPGTRSAGLLSNLPASNVNNATVPVTVEGGTTLSATEAPAADVQVASGEVFRALAIPLIGGRAFSSADGAETAKVAVVSRGMAQAFWPDRSALGQRLKAGFANADQPWLTVVGIVGDVRQNWWDPRPRPTLYLPYRQSPRRLLDVAMRTESDPLAAAAAARKAASGIDPEVALRDVQPLEGVIGDSLAIVRLMGNLMIAFGGLALALAALGLYGMQAHAVAQRRQELGTRMALGASQADVLSLVLGGALRLSAVGLGLGAPAALGLSRALASQVFGVVDVEVPVLVGLALALLATMLAAGFVPAWRATRIDPVGALRYE